MNFFFFYFDDISLVKIIASDGKKRKMNKLETRLFRRAHFYSGFNAGIALKRAGEKKKKKN